MTSFAKYVAVLSAGLILVAALPGNADDNKTPKPDGKSTPAKKSKKPKPDATPSVKKRVDVPVEKGHPSYGMFIPYFTPDGKRQMNFTIGVASRIDDNHIDMKDMQIETFEDGKHEMSINLPTSIFDTDTSVVTSQQHVIIQRDDFELTGECMLFNTVTKQGALGGNVHMLIYNLDNETGESAAKAANATNPESQEK